MNRETIISDLNVAAARVAELRAAEVVDADALSDAVVALDACRSELAAFDAKSVTIAPAADRAASVSFGRSAAEKLAGAPVGTSVTIDRTLFADPFGNNNGEQDVTHPQVAPLSTQPDAPVRFVDTLAVAPASSDAVSYIRETGFSNAAAARVAGDPAAESELTFTKVTEPIANIAHFIRVAEETLADNGALSSVIDRRGVSGIRTKIDQQLLAASNAANGVKSVVAAADVYTYDTSTESLADAIFNAKMGQMDLGFDPRFVVVSAANYAALVTAKAVDGHYLGNGPFGASNGTIWGLTIVVDSNLTTADALVYDNAGATLWVRDNANVATDRDIVNNLLTVRVQSRVQVAVEQPSAFVAILPVGS